MVYHIALLIFNMVSEPNFILGIKQKSLASKEDSHVHITIRSHTCLFARSKLHSISQPPWLTAVSKSSNQASRDLTYHICANPSFSCQNQPHRRAPRPPARKTQKSSKPKPSHTPLRAEVSFGKSPPCRLRFLTSRSSSWYTRRPDGLVIHRSTWVENLVVIRCCTRRHAPLGFLAAPPRAGEHCMLLPRVDTAADVI